MTRPGAARLAVFGSVDGLTMFMGIVIGILVSGHGQAAAWHAAAGGGIGELVGMTAGQFQSDPGGGWKLAAACGAAGCAACLLPGVPFAVAAGAAAAVASAAVAVAIGAVICWLRPQKGWRAVALTYGVLAAAAVISGLAGLI